MLPAEGVGLGVALRPEALCVGVPPSFQAIDPLLCRSVDGVEMPERGDHELPCGSIEFQWTMS